MVQLPLNFLISSYNTGNLRIWHVIICWVRLPYSGIVHFKVNRFSQRFNLEILALPTGHEPLR